DTQSRTDRRADADEDGGEDHLAEILGGEDRADLERLALGDRQPAAEMPAWTMKPTSTKTMANTAPVNRKPTAPTSDMSSGSIAVNGSVTRYQMKLTAAAPT